MVKIGKARDPQERMAALQTGCPYDLVMVGTRRCRSDRHAEATEKELHRQFSVDRRRGEWFVYHDRNARVIAAILGTPSLGLHETIDTARREVSHQKYGMLTRKQRYRELERGKVDAALAAMSELDREFRAITQ